MILLVALHGVIAAVLFPSRAHLCRKSFIVATIAPLGALVWLCIQLPNIIDGPIIEQHLSWGPSSDCRSISASAGSAR